MNVRDSRAHNHPPRWNGAPSQDLLVIRRNHKTGEVSLIPFRNSRTLHVKLSVVQSAN